MYGDRINSKGKSRKFKKIVPGKCIFPVRFKGKIFNECINGHTGKWCATKLTKKGTTDTWAYCVDSSVINAAQTLVNLKRSKKNKIDKLSNNQIVNKITPTPKAMKNVHQDESSQTSHAKTPSTPMRASFIADPNTKIVRNVGGVDGLHLMTNAFSEEIEKRLFLNNDFFLPSTNSSGWQFTYEEQHKSGKRCHSIPNIPNPFIPDDAYRLCNLVRDTGLHNELVTPDYCLGLSYPGKESSVGGSEFHMHFDSRFKWGESVVGVTLGQGCIMHFVKSGKRVNIKLSRRSIYIMTGSARTEWKHGISKLSSKNLAGFPSYPDWNPLGMRRSLTLRCTKAVSDAFIEKELEKNPDDKRLQERLEEQKKYRPQLTGKRLTNADLSTLRRKAKNDLNMILAYNTNIRF